MAWNDVGNQGSGGNGGNSDLMEIKDGRNVIRCLFPESGPRSWWNYAISTPNDDYRTWVSPAKDQDFFAVNRKIFRATPRHAGHVWDYATNQVKVLEQGNQVWEGVKSLIDAGINIYNRDLVIMKSGEKRTTEYKVVAMDPSTFAHSPTEFPDMDTMYAPPTYEQVLEDLKSMGFLNPVQIFSTRPMSEQEALATVVPFGQHKNKTIMQVYQADNQYINFLATKVDRAEVKEAARIVSNQYMSTAYPTIGVAPSLEEVTYAPPAPAANEQPAAPPVTPSVPPVTPSVAPVTPPPAQPPVWQQPTTPIPANAPPAGAQTAPPTPAWQQPAPPVAPVVPVAPPTQPAWQQPVAAQAPAAVAPGADRAGLMAAINTAFEQNPKYKDFMLIISVMKEASAPNGKTSINDFTDAELQRLMQLVSI